MAQATQDIEVVIRAKDELTPVLRRIVRRLWWYRWGPLVVQLLVVILVVCVFMLGRVTA